MSTTLSEILETLKLEKYIDALLEAGYKDLGCFDFECTTFEEMLKELIEDVPMKKPPARKLLVHLRKQKQGTLNEQQEQVREFIKMDNNQKQEKHQDDLNKKESTDHDEAATSSTPPPPQVVYHYDVCSICQENVSLLDVTTYKTCSGCGKCIHTKCRIDLGASKLSLETRNSCPMCRAKTTPK